MGSTRSSPRGRSPARSWPSAPPSCSSTSSRGWSMGSIGAAASPSTKRERNYESTPAPLPALPALVAGAPVQPAAAQEPYPSRPISLVAPFPPGGVADLTARPVAAAMEKALRQPVGVVNKTGAAGAGGVQYVATSKPDGYTL